MGRVELTPDEGIVFIRESDDDLTEESYKRVLAWKAAYEREQWIEAHPEYEITAYKMPKDYAVQGWFWQWEQFGKVDGELITTDCDGFPTYAAAVTDAMEREGA